MFSISTKITDLTQPRSQVFSDTEPFLALPCTIDIILLDKAIFFQI